MKFIYPSFLFALAAIAIPIIIHLFNFRKFKKIYFPDIRFLQSVKQETQSKSKLKHLLVLISRILAISSLVIAFSQPYIPLGNKEINLKNKVISIYVDNSFSMEAVNENGTLLDEAKRKAKEIAMAYRQSDEFQLLTNDFEGRHQRLFNRDEFLEMINEIKISPSVKTLSEAVSRQNDLINNYTIGKYIYMVSDFQKSISDIEKINKDSSVNISFIPLNVKESPNLYIDSCWFLSPVRQLNKVEKLMVRVKNISGKSFENIPLKLFINKKQKALASIDIGENSQTDVLLSFTVNEAGIQNCRLEITDYPVVFDDKFYFSFTVNNKIYVSIINGKDENKYLNSLFINDSAIVLKNSQEDKIDYSKLSGNSFIILNEVEKISSGLSQELNKFVSNGSSLLVIPARKIDFDSYKSFLSSLQSKYFEKADSSELKVDKVNFENILFKDVFEKIPENIELPKIKYHYVLSKNLRSMEEYILKLQNGDMFLSSQNFNKGKIYLLCSPLNDESGNFQKQAIFVPAVYNIALQSQPTSPLFYTIGNDENIELSNINLSGEDIFKIKDISSDFTVIPEHKLLNSQYFLNIHNQITNAGNYIVSVKDKDLTGVSFNFNRKESALNYYDDAEIEDLSVKAKLSNSSVIYTKNTSLTKTILEYNQGKKLWKIFVILALLFLAAEIALLRFWK
ncbi:MAG: BatA domain-containing protein [Bacteroidales bacterium]|nr:BatA domain-containing protein [Bacteroidales bacterium]